MSVPYPIASKLTTSGATNSGVPNNTWSLFSGLNFLAKPKSMIFIRFPVLVRHKMFSGYNLNNINRTYYFVYNINKNTTHINTICYNM